MRILRLLKDDSRQLATQDAVCALERDIKFIRISLEKHEIVQDWKLSVPLQMQASSPDAPSRAYTYNKDDKTRAHIMPTGISPRGSAVWQAFRSYREQGILVGAARAI